jgi:hypothetical protein
MATTVIRITHNKVGSELGATGRLAGHETNADAREVCLRAAEVLTRIASGLEPATVEFQIGGATAVRATGTITLSSAAGAVGATIDGTLVTATAAGGDANTAALVAAAINANATTKTKVYATATGAVVTLRAMQPGVNGNKVTLVASGTGATVSGATLTAGAGDDAIPVTYTRT